MLPREVLLMISNAPKDEGKRPDNEGAHSDGTRDDRPDATRNPSKSNVALVSQTTGTANLAEWAKLDLKDQTAGVLRVSRIRHDHLFGILAEEVTLPFARFPRLADSDAILDIAEIARRHGLSLGRSTERVSFVSAPRDVARLLGSLWERAY
jgi:DNA-binding GntR family transcriptional regulator